jgi:hypothetical protein
MREPMSQAKSSARGTRARIAVLSERSTEERYAQGTSGARRLRSGSRREAWRRTEMGTNHIACFGVWRRGTRRQAAQVNRTGMTRWHMPHRQDAVFTLAGAQKSEAINEG